MSWAPTRKIMSRAELAGHRTDEHGRRWGDDGYDEMDVAARKGWRVLAGWGRDGWDLGEWPYVCIYVRDVAIDNGFQLMQICEGDHEYWSFESNGEREAAIDYLFLWYAAGCEYKDFPINYENRDDLDKGELDIDIRFRGPVRYNEESDVA